MLDERVHNIGIIYKHSTKMTDVNLRVDLTYGVNLILKFWERKVLSRVKKPRKATY